MNLQEKPLFMSLQKDAPASAGHSEEIMFRKSLSRILFSGVALAMMAGAASAEGIGASLLTQQHPFYISLADAMKKEAQAENVPLEIAIANQDLSKQLADVEDFITKGVDVIVISPVDSKGVRSAINKAQKAGIKVITVDVPANNVDVTSFVGTDNFAGGEKAAELMAKSIGERAMSPLSITRRSSRSSIASKASRRASPNIRTSRSLRSSRASPVRKPFRLHRTSCRPTRISSASSASATTPHWPLPRR